MKTCIWYDVDEKLPSKTDYYLAFKGYSMGDNETGCDYYYWDSKQHEWRDNSLNTAYTANVIYWTDADPATWYEESSRLRKSKTKKEKSVTEQAAWDDLQEAVKRYETIRALCAQS